MDTLDKRVDKFWQHDITQSLTTVPLVVTRS